MHIRLSFVLLALVLSACAQAAGPHGTQPGQPYTDTGYITITDQVAQALADTGAGFVRINFRLGAQPSDNPQWYAAYDLIVDRLRSRGLEVVALMTNEAWRGGQNQWIENAYETTGGDGWNSYLDGWCNFFLRAATHFEGKIKYWELWNEPDCLAVIYPSNFGALLAHAYDLARTNDLDVEIISGGVCGGYSPFGPDYIRNTYDVSINHTGWFTQMKNKWGTYPLDHIGFHIYPNCGGALDTNWLSNYVDDVYSAYRTYEGTATTKKMFLTEIGWQTGGTGCHVDEATQAANLSAAFQVINSKPAVKHVNWFFLKDEPAAGLYFGVFKSSGLWEADKKPSWTDLKQQCTFEGRWSAGGEIDQPILDYYNARGHPAVGNPYNNGSSAWVHNWDFGPVQDYDGGTLGRMIVFDSADGQGHSVRGGILPAAIDNHSVLEFPLADAISTGTGEKQEFEGGYITWTESGGAVVTLYPAKVPRDNSDTGFTASSSWVHKTATDAYKGNYRRRSGTSTNSDPAVWDVSLPQAGNWDVYVRYPAVSSATSTATYEVVHDSGTGSVVVNQQERSARWNLIGNFTFTGGAVIRLSSQGPSDAFIIADAIRFIGPTSQSDTTPPTTPVVTDDGEYTTTATQLHASWQSADPESGIERFEYAISTSETDPGSGYLVGWTSTGTQNSVTCSVSLAQGATYYFYVRAFNGAGMQSEVGVSDGVTVDVSPPTRPVVTDDGNYTGNPSMLHCAWSSTDAESGVAGYEYCVGTAPYASDVAPVCDAGADSEAWVDGLSLTVGQTYYFTVRSRNAAGSESTQWYSDGITFQSALQCESVADALAQPDSTVVLLSNKAISGTFSDRVYLWEPGGFGGIGIATARSLPEGSAVDVTGTLSTLAGERVLTTGSVTPVQQQ